VDLGKKFDFSSKISEKSQLFLVILHKNAIFSRQIFEKFRFFQAISIFQAKIGHLQLLLCKLFY